MENSTSPTVEDPVWLTNTRNIYFFICGCISFLQWNKFLHRKLQQGRKRYPKTFLSITHLNTKVRSIPDRHKPHWSKEVKPKEQYTPAPSVCSPETPKTPTLGFSGTLCCDFHHPEWVWSTSIPSMQMTVQSNGQSRHCFFPLNQMLLAHSATWTSFSLVPRGPFQLGQANKKCKYTQYSPVCCFPFADAPELIHMVGPGGIWTLAPVLVNAVFEVKGICCADDQSQVGWTW